MPYRFMGKDVEETSEQREETCKVCPDHLTRQKNASKLAKVVSKRGGESRVRASFHGSCFTGSGAQTSPPYPPPPVGWLLSTQVPSQRKFVQSAVLGGCP